MQPLLEVGLVGGFVKWLIELDFLTVYDCLVFGHFRDPRFVTSNYSIELASC